MCSSPSLGQSDCVSSGPISTASHALRAASGTAKPMVSSPWACRTLFLRSSETPLKNSNRTTKWATPAKAVAPMIFDTNSTMPRAETTSASRS